MYDVGTILGSLLIGFLTDLMYSRRAPITLVAIVFAGFLQILLIIVDADKKGLYGFVVFMLGACIGGVACVISGIACADLVILTLIYISL